LDTHYILFKSNDLFDAYTQLLGTTVRFISEKARILQEFEDLKKENESELTQAINDTRERYLEIESEINNWML
jgi:hypothetical protein